MITGTKVCYLEYFRRDKLLVEINCLCTGLSMYEASYPLQKLLSSDTQAWRPSIPQTVSHPYLPCPLWAETTADGLGWLLYASAQAGWHQGGHGTTAAAMVDN
jgi:hypothetical protein